MGASQNNHYRGISGTMRALRSPLLLLSAILGIHGSAGLRAEESGSELASATGAEYASETGPPTELHAPDQKLIDASWLKSKFIGKWAPPAVADANVRHRNMHYSNGTHYVGADGLYRITTHAYDLLGLGVFRRPPEINGDLREGELVRWEQLPRLPAPSSGRQVIRGLMESNGRIFWTHKQYYAVSGKDHPSQAWVDASGVHGFYRLDGRQISGLRNPYSHNKVAGYLALAPSGIEADYLCGLLGTPGAGSASGGPSLYAVRAQPYGDRLPAVCLMAWNIMDEIDGAPHRADVPLNRTARANGVAWIECKEARGVLFTMRRGVGFWWYGEADTVIDGVRRVDQYSHSKGGHFEEYANEIWVYDPLELREVYAGERHPSEVQLKTILPWSKLGLHVTSGYNMMSASHDGDRLTIVFANPKSVPVLCEFDLGK